ncbi:Peroxidase 29 [Sesamum alatum]|uniref:Peroxidase n=1 Tax=Sesamum alatum TaxID=300844 RepID=A0AAE2CD49_9LAMI|nr:Peroxidase 29 [Sesamum alatum]
MDLAVVFLAIFALSSHALEAKGLPSNGLSYDYYQKTCPQVEKIVRDSMNAFTSADPNTSAAILRLVFHDCQVGGCDGSVLLNIKDPQHEAEMDSPKNFGIRKREVIDEIKSKIEAACPQRVSCADILVLAARDAVAIAGGPTISVPLGRRDTAVAHSRQEADVGLPRNEVNLTKALQVFSQEVGITFDETVAILGAHTLGLTHCDCLMERLYQNSTVLPPGSEAEYVKYLTKVCPEGGQGRFTTTLNLDPTPRTFDNKYYVNALNGHGVIALDAEMARDPRSVNLVKKFASDQDAFFKVFSSAFVKITTLGVLTGDKGVVRKKCSVL